MKFSGFLSFLYDGIWPKPSKTGQNDVKIAKNDPK